MSAILLVRFSSVQLFPTQTFNSLLGFFVAVASLSTIVVGRIRNRVVDGQFGLMRLRIMSLSRLPPVLMSCISIVMRGMRWTDRILVSWLLRLTVVTRFLSWEVYESWWTDGCLLAYMGVPLRFSTYRDMRFETEDTIIFGNLFMIWYKWWKLGREGKAIGLWICLGGLGWVIFGLQICFHKFLKFFSGFLK